MLTEEFGALNDTIPEDEQVTILSKLILENSLLRELSKAADTIIATRLCPRTNLKETAYKYLFNFLCCPRLGFRAANWLTISLDEHNPFIRFEWSNNGIIEDCAFPIVVYLPAYINLELHKNLYNFIKTTIADSKYIRKELETKE